MRQVKRRSYESKKKWLGFTFIIPWLVGCTTFFVRPFLMTLYYSLCDVKVLDEGVSMKFVGLKNYIHAFTGDNEFLPKFTESMNNTLFQVPLILMFSLFIAVILNQKFRGRVFFRTVYFLPVIIASGVVISLIRGDAFSQQLLSGERSSMMFQAVSMEQLLLKSGIINEKVVNSMFYVINNIFDLLWKSGVQILIFIAGLKTIPPALYEVARIEGANAWETFWMVTFKMLSPIIVVNVVYTIIDSFNDYLNPIIMYISQTSRSLNIQFASAMAWMYFLVVLIITGTVLAIISKRAFSYTD